MPIQELLVLHHSHMDIGYTHPQRLVWELHDRHIDEAIDLCEKTANYPEGSRMKWTCEVMNVVLHWLETASPKQIERMKKLVKSGRIGFGSMLCHWTAAHQEDLLQDSLAGMKILREKLGADFAAAVQTDVNGVPWSVPDMLLDAGIGRLMMNINIHMGGFPGARPDIFRWQTPSGREMTVFSGEHYNAFTRETGIRTGAPGAVGSSAAGVASLERMETGLNLYFKRLEKKGWKHDFAILTATHPFMDDNNPPNPELPEVVRQWNESGRAPFIRIVSLNEMFDRIAKIDKKKIPVRTGDWTDYWTSGIGASALDVAMSRRAHGALFAARALETRLPADAKRAKAEAQAVESMHLANEHTWNTFASTGALGCGGSGRIEPVPEAEQRLYKSDQCAGALSLARMARRDALDALAGNPAQSRTEEGLVLFNPSELPRRVCLRLPNELIGGGYPLVAGTKHRLDVIEDILADTGATAWVGPVEIAPLSTKTVRISSLPRSVFTENLSRGKDWISSQFWRLNFNPQTGEITSLVHLASGAEAFDKAAGHGLFEPVREILAQWSPLAKKVNDPRASIFSATEINFDEVVHSDIGAWETEWKAAYAKPTASRAEVWIDGEGVHLVRHLEIAGVKGEMKQTVSLPAHEDRVRFTAYFNKADEMAPESLYFAFPFKSPKAQAHFDTAGVAVAFGKEQLAGASRGWFTAGSFVAVEGEKKAGCFTLACPDAPLFHLGGFNYGRNIQDAKGLNQALVMGWATNNCWNTNFRASQPGFMRFRYELTWTPAFNAAQSSKFAAAVARPVVFHPAVRIDGGAKETALITGLGENTTLVSLKPGTDGSVIVGLRNHASKPAKAAPSFPGRTITAIARIDALEEGAQSLPAGKPFDLRARATTWLRVSFLPPAKKK